MIGRVNQTTDSKYKISHRYIKNYFGNLPFKDVSKIEYQQFLDKFAMDDQILYKDITHNVILGGLKSKSKDFKFLELN